MVITVSGMVGSGKTTVTGHVGGFLRSRDIDPRVLRFQSLPCFAFLRTSLRPARRSVGDAVTAAVDAPRVRWSGYQRKRLTAPLALVYIARIVAFRAYRLLWRSDDLRVLNRYFYDLFVHLRLTTKIERLYYAVLRSMVPVPDIAFLVVAEPDTIAGRRPNYAEEYLTEVAAAYRRIHSDFPELIEIRTDPGEPWLEGVDRILADRVTRGGRRAAT